MTFPCKKTHVPALLVLSILPALACQTIRRNGATPASAGGSARAVQLPTDPGGTETPFHPFACPEGAEYGVFGFASRVTKVEPADYGLVNAPVAIEESSEKKFDILPASEERNIQIDVCIKGEDLEVVRMTMAIPKILPAGTPRIKGVKVETLIFEKNLAHEEPSGQNWAYLRVPIAKMKPKGLKEAFYGDPSKLDFKVTLSDKSVVSMRSVKKGNDWITAEFTQESTMQGKAMKSDFGLSGSLEFGTPFVGLMKCTTGKTPEAEKYTIGTATLVVDGCHSYSHRSGPDHSYYWYNVVLNDRNEALPPNERKESVLDKKSIEKRIELAITHHNFADTLVIRMPAAIYACFLGELEDPSVGAFADDIPTDRLTIGVKFPCLVRYGEGDWQNTQIIKMP